jgi:hypothetical protein
MAHKLRGDVYRETGKYNKALVDYYKAVKLVPKYTEGYCERANIHERH